MAELIKLDNLSVTLGGKLVLDEITFSVQAGQLTGVIGPNGAGKTTLLRTILGLVPIHKGELTVNGFPMLGRHEIRSKTGYMPQCQSFERRFPLSAGDVVATGLLSPETLLRRLTEKEERIESALDSVSMKFFINRPFQDLSGGEQQRVLLARSLVRQPILLLLDEPNAGLDFPAQQRFIELLQKLKEKEGLTIILVSHDILSVAAVADQLVCINRTMHIHGRPADVLTSPHLGQAYRCQFDFLSSSGDKTGC